MDYHYKEIGSFEAKTHFAQILAEVVQGNEVTITKHGKRIAVIVPWEKKSSSDATQEAIDTITSLRKNIQLNPIEKSSVHLSIKDMIEEGRK